MDIQLKYDRELYEGFTCTDWCAREYAAAAKKFLGMNLKPLGNGFPEHHPNWKYFVKVLKRIMECDATPKDWMEAQFVGATRANVPRPNALSTQAAEDRWRSYVDSRNLPALIKQQELDLRTYMERFGMTAHEVVSNLHWTEFYDWFRALYMDPVPDTWKPRVRDQLGSGALRKAIMEARNYRGELLYDLEALESRLE